MIDYEKQLDPIIDSHCQYSLRAGQAHVIDFDLPSLERQLLRRFFLGKPVIKLDIPQVCTHTRVATTSCIVTLV